MKKVSVLFCLLLSLHLVAGQSVELIKKQKLLEIFEQDSSIVVVNAWATWCKPCIEEMPLFKKADSLYGLKVKFVFISFDFSEDTGRVNRMIKKLAIPGKHYLIDETDMNALINDLDTAWSGSLPATWFLYAKYRKPHYLNFEHFHDIQKEIESLLAASYE